MTSAGVMDDNFQENLVALAIDEAHCVKKL